MRSRQPISHETLIIVITKSAFCRDLVDLDRPSAASHHHVHMTSKAHAIISAANMHISTTVAHQSLKTKVAISAIRARTVSTSSKSTDGGCSGLWRTTSGGKLSADTLGSVGRRKSWKPVWVSYWGGCCRVCVSIIVGSICRCRK